MCPGSAEGEGHGAPLQVRTETAAALMCRPVRECVECLAMVGCCGLRTSYCGVCSLWLGVGTRPPCPILTGSAEGLYLVGELENLANYADEMWG